MLVKKIICSHCKTSLKSAAGIPEGTTIPCPKCKKKFKVEAPDDEEVVEDFEVMDADDEEEDEETPKKKPTPKAAEKNAFATLGMDDKLKKKKPPRDDDNRPKKKAQSRDEDDEDDDRPRKKKKKKKKKSAYAELKENVWVRVSVLGVLLIGLGIAIYIRWGRTKPPDTTETEVVKNDDEDADKKPPEVKKSVSKVSAELARFQGRWKPTMATQNGTRVPDAVMDALALHWSGDKVIPIADPSEVARCLIINSTSNPAEMDFRNDDKKQIDRGIYRFVNNDTLEICFSFKDAARPTDFKAEAGSEYLHMIMKRQPGVAAPEIPKKDSPKAEQLHGKWKLDSKLEDFNMTLEYQSDGKFIEMRMQTENGVMMESMRSGSWRYLRAGTALNSMVIERGFETGTREYVVQFLEPDKIDHTVDQKSGRQSLFFVRE